MTSERPDGSARCRRYAADVLSGSIVVGSYARLACQRFVDDLARAEAGDPEFPYRFDDGLADRIVKFIEKMPHTKGKWASLKELLVLADWQCFIEGNLFGWVRVDSGKRRFRSAYEEVPRKNGKSMRMAARGIYLFAADNEAGAEVYSGATSERQAYEVFRPAWAMVDKLPPLRARFGIEQTGNARNPGTMYTTEDMSKFETMIGKPGDGASPHGALIDEYHEHDTDAMVDTMQTGMGAREQPLLSIITTAGSNLGGPCYEKRRDIIRILERQVFDESAFGIIYGLDAGDNWSDVASLRKANPNYGISVFPEFLEAQLSEAKRSAAKQNAFRTKHLNEWVGARTIWMNMLAWQRQKREMDLDLLRPSRCWIACDLASKKDVAAIVLLFELPGRQFYCVPKFYAPESAAEDNEKYRDLALGQFMTLTPGNMTDYAFIEEEIVSLAARFNVQDVAFDDWQANYLMTRLMQRGVKIVEFNQTVKNMSEPMKEVEARVLNRTLWHDGNQCMTWMMGNVAARIDAKENIYPRKDNENDPRCKIDGPVGLIMAQGRAITNEDAGDMAGFFASPVIA